MNEKRKNVKAQAMEAKLDKFVAAYHAALENSDPKAVKISAGNVKMGSVPSVSTLPYLTCPGICRETCGPDCYAAKIANLRPTVAAAYAHNTALAVQDPESYFTQISAACRGYRFFRWHVSGDIINAAYFVGMVKVARENPHCVFLAFTKRFNVVNEWIDNNGPLPVNMKILFSGWEEMQPENPHKLPETNVLPKDHSGCWWDLPDGWTVCGGNCFECACAGVGCWKAESGETVAFRKH